MIFIFKLILTREGRIQQKTVFDFESVAQTNGVISQSNLFKSIKDEPTVIKTFTSRS